jgi:hypothetical protein
LRLVRFHASNPSKKEDKMTTSIQDLLNQQQSIEVQIAELVKPPVEAARDALSTSAVETLVTDLTAIRDLLPAGMPKEQIGNVITVLTAVPGLLTEEAQRLTNLITPPASVEEPPVE